MVGLGIAGRGCGTRARAGSFELTVEAATATEALGATEADEATEALGALGVGAWSSCLGDAIEGAEGAAACDNERPTRTIAANATLAATTSATRRDRRHLPVVEGAGGKSAWSAVSTAGVGPGVRSERTGLESVSALEPGAGSATPRTDASSLICRVTVGHRFA